MNRLTQTATKVAILWLVFSVIPIAYYSHLTDKNRRIIQSQMEQQGGQFLSYVDSKASQIHDQIEKTFYELSHSALLLDFAKTRRNDYRRYLESQWYLTTLNSHFFYQLRYLNRHGKEIIRVDYAETMDKPFIVPKNNLQNKSQRDYFLYAQQLSKGEQGTFGIDLEYEHNQPIVPHKPAYRLIYPIENEAQRLGYFIANLDVLNITRQIAATEQNLSVDFIDSQGYYVASSYPGKRFALASEKSDGRQLARQYPAMWQKIKKQDQRVGSYLAENGLFVYKSLLTPIFGAGDNMTMLTFFPRPYLDQLMVQISKQTRNEALLLFMALGLIAVVLALVWEDYQRTKLEQTLNRMLIDHGMAVALTDEQQRILKTNSRFCKMVGLEEAQLAGTNILSYQPSPTLQETMKVNLESMHEWNGQLTLISPDGRETVCQAEIHAMRMLTSTLQRKRYYVYAFSDISEHHNVIVALQEQKDRDPITTLWNKRKFHQNLLRCARLKEYNQDETHTCLAIVDIDNFKKINDSQGHACGDEVIIQLANVLISQLRESDFIARIGGDEFAVILSNADHNLAVQMMQRVCNAVASWKFHPVTISIGVTEIGTNAEQTFCQAEALLRNSMELN